jgi:hypothetical protein
MRDEVGDDGGICPRSPDRVPRGAAGRQDASGSLHDENVVRAEPRAGGSPDRWTIVAFDSLPWLALDRLQAAPPFRQLPLECSVAYTTPEPAPSIPLHGYKLPFKDWYSREAPGYYTPVAAYVDPGSPQALMLVKVVDEQRSVASLGSTTSCSFDRPWAPYARVALVPFAVIADVVTSPFQAVYFLLIGMSH